jgi:hypothetical protein
VEAAGRERLVLDLSCRRKGDGRYYVVTDRWQRFSELVVDEATLADLGALPPALAGRLRGAGCCALGCARPLKHVKAELLPAGLQRRRARRPARTDVDVGGGRAWKARAGRAQAAAARSSWCMAWTWRACGWAWTRSSCACSARPRRCRSPTPAACARWRAPGPGGQAGLGRVALRTACNTWRARAWGQKTETTQSLLGFRHCFSVPLGPAASAAVLMWQPGNGVSRQTYAIVRRSTPLQLPIVSFRLCAALGYGVRLARHPTPLLPYPHYRRGRRPGRSAEAVEEPE